MSSINLLRLATRTRSPKFFRPQQAARQLPVLTAPSPVSVACTCFSTSVRRAVDKDGQEAADHHEESFEEFTARYGAIGRKPLRVRYWGSPIEPHLRGL